MVRKFTSRSDPQYRVAAERVQKLGQWEYAQETVRYLARQLLGPGAWAVDVGAGVGHITAILVTAVSPGGKVIAFEPVAALLGPLKQQVFQSKGWRLGVSLDLRLQAAWSDAHLIPFTEAKQRPIISGFNPPGLQPGEQKLVYRVRPIPLDKALPRKHWPRIRLLHVDVPGSYHVLRGAQELLSHSRCPVVFTYTQVHSVDPADYTLADSAHLLSAMGYALFCQLLLPIQEDDWPSESLGRWFFAFPPDIDTVALIKELIRSLYAPFPKLLSEEP